MDSSVSANNKAHRHLAPHRRLIQQRIRRRQRLRRTQTFATRRRATRQHRSRRGAMQPAHPNCTLPHFRRKTRWRRTNRAYANRCAHREHDNPSPHNPHPAQLRESKPQLNSLIHKGASHIPAASECILLITLCLITSRGIRPRSRVKVLAALFTSHRGLTHTTCAHILCE